MRKHCENHGTNKGLYAGMAELLQHRRHEEQHRITERMAVQAHPYVYLEAVETAEDTKAKAAGARVA